MRISMTSTMFAVASAALTAGTLLFSVPASAGTIDATPRQVEVHYSDLDLNNAADRATLHHRLSAAAYNVCKIDDDSIGQAASAACRDKAMANATHRMDSLIAATATPKRVVLR